jgi:hypothetical protein
MVYRYEAIGTQCNETTNQFKLNRDASYDPDCGTDHLAQLRSPQLTPPIRLVIRKPPWTDDGEPQRLPRVQVQVGEPCVFHVCDVTRDFGSCRVSVSGRDLKIERRE